jgi:SpoVK/Ycf46/Vps4 family AAA+-type ATPase
MAGYIAKRDSLAAEAVALYKKYVPTTGFVLVQHNVNYSYAYSDGCLQYAVDYYSRKKVTKFHLSALTPITSSLVCFASGIGIHKRSKTRLSFTDRTGAFKLEFSDGSILVLLKWWSGSGQSQTIVSMVVGETPTFHNWLKFTEAADKINSRPKNGIFTVKFDSQRATVNYEKLKKIQKTPVIHPSVVDVTTDMDNYFENIAEFTKYGMSGVRKVLLVGPPGTGKSSYAYKVAARYEKEKSVVFADSITSVAMHLKKCAKANVSTIIIWEDAESTGLRNAGSDILNFLDGIDQPQTKAGAYIMMTTNYPEMIDARIKKRPGRVDRIFEFGTLTGEHALMCAQIYFEDLFPYKLTDASDEARAHFLALANIVTGMSGASIKGLAYSSKLYAAGQKLPITLELVKIVKDELAEDLSKVDKYAQDTSSTKSVGFGNRYRVDKLEDLSWERIIGDL